MTGLNISTLSYIFKQVILNILVNLIWIPEAACRNLTDFTRRDCFSINLSGIILQIYPKEKGFSKNIGLKTSKKETLSNYNFDSSSRYSSLDNLITFIYSKS
jgi:hypothetical protein